MAISKLINPPMLATGATMETTINDLASLFINRLSPIEKIKFKVMLEHNDEVAKSVANYYNVPKSEFVKEIKKIMNGENINE